MTHSTSKLLLQIIFPGCAQWLFSFNGLQTVWPLTPEALLSTNLPLTGYYLRILEPLTMSRVRSASLWETRKATKTTFKLTPTSDVHFDFHGVVVPTSAHLFATWWLLSVMHAVFFYRECCLQMELYSFRILQYLILDRICFINGSQIPSVSLRLRRFTINCSDFIQSGLQSSTDLYTEWYSIK